MTTLVIAVRDGTDQLAAVHLAMSDEEAEAVVAEIAGLGPIWQFPVDLDDPIQWYGE